MRNRDKTRQSTSSPTPPPRTALWNCLLLGFALLISCMLYWPVTGANWFYDDSDYVLSDPRLQHLEFFLPNQCMVPHPLAEGLGAESPYLPGYDRPLISDRYLWRLSFALERRLFGLNPAVAHSINLLIHFAAIGALFFALSALLRVYARERHLCNAMPGDTGFLAYLPGLAALLFAVHPWASEPVCYVSARDGSMGTVFVHLGTGFWAHALNREAPRGRRFFCLTLALLCVPPAFACKENFLVAPALYVLAVWPLLWSRHWANSRRVAVILALGTVMLLAAFGWFGIQASERASGLLAQTAGGRGATYFFEIQSPLLLKTLGDQIPAVRVALEANHPGWTPAACWLALLANAALFLLGTLLAARWPLLLALGGFYVAALPTNSILPRPDFLAMRNFYLPAACIATLIAGGALWLHSKASASPSRRWYIPALCAVLLFYWAGNTGIWARQFIQPIAVWRHTVAIAPDHAVVRLNLAAEILAQDAPLPPDRAHQTEAEQEIIAALKAEDSPTMAWQSPRPRAVRRALALRMLGILRVLNGNLAEASDYFRRSYTEQPLVVTWVAWAETSYSQGARDKVAEVLTQGEERWPGAWWTCALRGLFHASTQSTETLDASVIRDLTEAESAADAQQPELRSLQGRALYALAQTPAARPRINALLDRMIRLGVSSRDINQLKLILNLQTK